jgi:predicted RNA-binding Zn-ribbon protein involved in translation (DUF1610 family)
MSAALRCPACGSDDVDRCEPHPTAVGWHVHACNTCGFTSGDHRRNVGACPP